MLPDLTNASWIHSKKKAQLMVDDKAIIEIEFTRKVAFLKIGKQKFEIKEEGFWLPKIIISEQDEIVSMQKELGIWGTKSEFVIDSQPYTASTKQGKLFNINYSKAEGDVLIYKLDTAKNKPIISFEIKNKCLPEKHLLLLLTLGFYSMKNVAIEVLSDCFIISAVA